MPIYVKQNKLLGNKVRLNSTSGRIYGGGGFDNDVSLSAYYNKI